MNTYITEHETADAFAEMGEREEALMAERARIEAGIIASKRLEEENAYLLSLRGTDGEPLWVPGGPTGARLALV